MLDQGYAPEEHGNPPEKIQLYCSECSDILEQYFTHSKQQISGKILKFDMCPTCFVECVNEDIDRRNVSQELCEKWNDIMKVIASEDRDLNKSEYETIFKIINYGKE